MAKIKVALDLENSILEFKQDLIGNRLIPSRYIVDSNALVFTSELESVINEIVTQVASNAVASYFLSISDAHIHDLDAMLPQVMDGFNFPVDKIANPISAIVDTIDAWLLSLSEHPSISSYSTVFYEIKRNTLFLELGEDIRHLYFDKMYQSKRWTGSWVSPDAESLKDVEDIR